jgi:hypothetical protein
VSPTGAARHSAVDLLAALLLAAGATMALWYYVGDNNGTNPLKGELAVRLGGESLGLPTLGDREDLWDYGSWCAFLAAENPPTDDHLVEWLAARPGVSNVHVSREPTPERFAQFRCDTKLIVHYDRPQDLDRVPIDWGALGYRVPKDDPPVVWFSGPLGRPKVPSGHSRGVLWLIAAACAHGALLVVVVLRGTILLFRRRVPTETPPWVFDTDADEEGAEGPPVPSAEKPSAMRVIALVVVAAVVLPMLVGLHERLVGKVVPHATARGWVWFSSSDWGNKVVVRERIYLAFLAAPLSAQLFFRYLLVGRWRAAGRPAVGVLLTAVTCAFLWLDLTLVPLGLAVGGILGWLALRGVPVLGLFALHALVNGILFGFLHTGTPPPDGHDPRLEGSWVSVEGSPNTLQQRIAFTAKGQATTVSGTGRGVIPGSRGGVPSGTPVEWYYLALDRDRVLLGVGGYTGKFRIAFDDHELVFTPPHRSPAEPIDRYRRATFPSR